MISAMPTLEGRIDRIWFDDEQCCSSRMISADVVLPTGSVLRIDEIRDDLENPELFDKFWSQSEKMGFENLRGRLVKVESFIESNWLHRIISWPASSIVKTA